MTQAVGDTGHTDFMTPEERAERNESLAGSYVGIGVRIDATDDGLTRVEAVFPDSPAEAAGLLAGDVIVEVDGQSTLDKTVDEVATSVRGERRPPSRSRSAPTAPVPSGSTTSSRRRPVAARFVDAHTGNDDGRRAP